MWARCCERKVRHILRGRCCLAVGWSLRQHALAPNPILKCTVHLLQTASPADNRIVFSREELRRRKPRHSLHRVALGLCTEAESGIKSMRYRPREIGILESGQRLAANVDDSGVYGN